MASAAVALSAGAKVSAAPGQQFSESVWKAPLVPAALAVTAGMVTDRYASVPLTFSLLGLSFALIAWAVARLSRSPGLPLVFLALAVTALGAAYHHSYRDIYLPTDIGNYAASEPRPVHLRGELVEEPAIIWGVSPDPLKSISSPNPTLAVLRISKLRGTEDWLPVSGKAQLVVGGPLIGFHVGDDVEVVGRLTAPSGPANPGELDQASLLRDQRIRARVLVEKTPEGVIHLKEGWIWSPLGWLAVVRGWGQRVFQQSLAGQSGLATALVLGEGSTMTRSDWEKFQRTGVIHALAITGQHLVILGAILWLALRLLGVRRRRGAILVAAFLLAYALLAGGRPPVMRSAVTVCAFCGGILLRRPTLRANSFALAWLTVAALNPTDLFGNGCQLSFLAVALMQWGVGAWSHSDPDPLNQLAEESRPPLQKVLRRLLRAVGWCYLASLVIWVAQAPLLAARLHLVAPVALAIGPPLMLLSWVALVSGFFLLLAAACCWPLVPLFAWGTRWSLAGCDFVVSHAERWPGSFWYVSDVPEWWLWVFYLALLAVLVLPPLRVRWRWPALAGLTWLCVGLGSSWARPASEEMRCTFLAVGHGGCTVLEVPGGRTLLYDAGALEGPDVTRRQIAPYLWSRGIGRIDEVILSHADLDHFNGLPALLERFAVGQVTCTPTFGEKKTLGVRLVLDFLRQHRIPVRIVRAGDRLSAGAVELDVLHPPAEGPEGNENARSMVLLVRHEGHAILLTGDLEGPGLRRVLDVPPGPVDVLMAPHHGSRAGNKQEVEARRDLVAKTEPRLVVACEGPPQWPRREPDPYAAGGVDYLGTWPHGAITIRSQAGRLLVETYQTHRQIVLKK